MRKGTHSCYECRKRKVRCIFAKDSKTCEGCDAKGRICTEQRRELLQTSGVETRETLKQKVARLEGIIQASGLSSGVITSNVEQLAVSLGGHQDEVGAASPSSSPTSALAPVSTPSSTDIVTVTMSTDSPQNIDPLVTLFDNAIVSPTTGGRRDSPYASRI